jgi:large subunit ribosomal protein L11
MATETVEALIEGGKATAAPPLGPALGPLGLNIGQVIADINKKTEAFKGMQVPIKIIADKAAKTYEITVGTPPASALIKKEAGLEKGSGKAKAELVADIRIEQVIKVSKMKEGNLHGKTPKARVKEIIGTCNSMGVMVEGKRAKDILADVDAGRFDEKITAGKTELSAAELKQLEEERKALQAELTRKHAEMEAKAKAIIDAGKANAKADNAIRTELLAAGLPEDYVDKVMPKTKAATGDAKGGKAAAAPAKKK